MMQLGDFPHSPTSKSRVPSRISQRISSPKRERLGLYTLHSREVFACPSRLLWLSTWLSLSGRIIPLYHLSVDINVDDSSRKFPAAAALSYPFSYLITFADELESCEETHVTTAYNTNVLGFRVDHVFVSWQKLFYPVTCITRSKWDSTCTVSIVMEHSPASNDLLVESNTTLATRTETSFEADEVGSREVRRNQRDSLDNSFSDSTHLWDNKFLKLRR